MLYPIWCVTFTLYIYSLLGIYEQSFQNETEGIPWVEKNIRAFKMNQTGLAYWTYILPNLPSQDIPAIQKYIPNMGYFWTISDFNIFDTASARLEKEKKGKRLETSFQTQGILYYLVLSLLRQVQTWFRRKRGTNVPNEVPTLVPATSIETIELELKQFSIYDTIEDDEVLHRLEDLKVTLDHSATYRNPDTYRKILNHTIFKSWDLKPSDLSLLVKKNQAQPKLGFSFQDYKKIVVFNRIFYKNRIYLI